MASIIDIYEEITVDEQTFVYKDGAFDDKTIVNDVTENVSNSAISDNPSFIIYNINIVYDAVGGYLSYTSHFSTLKVKVFPPKFFLNWSGLQRLGHLWDWL